MVTEEKWLPVHAVDGKDFTKSPASMSIAGSVGYTGYFYRDRISDSRHKPYEQEH